MQSSDNVIQEAVRLLEDRLRTWRVADMAISAPDDAKQMFCLRLAGEDREHFEVAFLDTQNRLIEVERLFSGTVDACAVHVREIARKALLHNARSVILAHNHPSGSPEPSGADCALTRHIREALQLFEMRVLDHVIVTGPTTATSMADRGLL